MDDQLLMQIDRRIDELHQCLCQRLDDLNDAIQATHSALSSRLEAHEAYHRRNEHRWGLVKLAERHPFRLALLTFIAAYAVLSSVTETAPWLQEAVKNFLKMLFSS